MGLPESLKNLAPLIDEWSIADVSRRVKKIGSAKSSVLRALAEGVLPRIEEIDAYLDTYVDHSLDESAYGLLRLAESALEAQTELDARATSDDLPE